MSKICFKGFVEVDALRGMGGRRGEGGRERSYGRRVRLRGRVESMEEGIDGREEGRGVVMVVGRLLCDRHG